MTATIYDLKMEQWLRQRNSGELKWKMKDGKVIPLKDMTDSHLENAIRIKSRSHEIISDANIGDIEA